jgi:hypothetical protein
MVPSKCAAQGPIVTTYLQGRAIAQAVSRRVRAQVRPRGICGGQSGAGAGFLRALRLSLPILIPPTASHSSSTIRGWYNRPNSGRRTKLTQSHPTPRNLKKAHNVTFRGDYRGGVVLDTGRIDHLQVATTNNYNTIDNFHILQISAR